MKRWRGGVMGRTILCPHCGSSMNEDILKKRNSENVCLVCGESLITSEDNSANKDISLSFGDGVELGENDSFDEDKIDFWWYEIREPDKERFIRGQVHTTCAKCGHLTGTAPYYIAKNRDYLLIDSRFSDRCDKCGNELKNHILSKRPADWVDTRKLDMWKRDENVPRCPICSSQRIHKLSLTNKAASVIAFGVFATGHVSKTYKCDVCGSKF